MSSSNRKIRCMIRTTELNNPKWPAKGAALKLLRGSKRFQIKVLNVDITKSIIKSNQTK